MKTEPAKNAALEAASQAAQAFELEQHAVESLRHLFEVNRRDLFKLLGAGLVVGFCARNNLAQESGRVMGENVPTDLASWLHIGEDGKVTVFTGKVEMGQNIRTSLTQQVAEELHSPMGSITLVMGDTDLTPFDMGTFGSRTTPQMGTRLRTVAASAREALVDMAAERWKMDRKTLVAKDGAVIDAHGSRKITYGELTRGQKLVKVAEAESSPQSAMRAQPAGLDPSPQSGKTAPPGGHDSSPQSGKTGQSGGHDSPVANPAQWHVAGTSTLKVDGKAFVTGAHQYTSDMALPGMLHGKVFRPPAFNSRLVSVDAKRAEQLPNVIVVHDGDFIGVAAPDPQTAEKTLELIEAQTQAPAQVSEAALFDYLRKDVDSQARGGFGGRSGGTTGSVENAMASAGKTLSQTYTVAYVQHAPLEPRAAVAEWHEGKLTVWTGTQRPFAVKEELAAAFHLSPEHVRVIVPDTGSAYGGKHTGECAVEAARLSKGAGKPVKLVWTREEEFTWAYFRPAGVIDVKSCISADGALMAWEFHNYNSGPAAIETPYNVANKKIEFHPAKNPPLRQGSYRGLAATANIFAREMHMDELAHLAGIDPLQFRLKNLTDPRLRAAFEAAANRFGWGKERATPERGFGIAGGFEKNGYLATCAEVAIDRARGQVRIVRVVESFDCGAVVNPNGLRNQIEGAIVQGIGGTMVEAIHFENGKVLNGRFRDYRVPRFRDLPRIEVVLIDRKDVPPAGAGETPLMGLAPAVAGAIFSASGIRLRSLPLMARPLELKG